MLKNAPTIAIGGFVTVENEPSKFLNFNKFQSTATLADLDFNSHYQIRSILLKVLRIPVRFSKFHPNVNDFQILQTLYV